MVSSYGSRPPLNVRLPPPHPPLFFHLCSRAKRRIDFKEALMEFRRCAQDDDQRVRSAARGLIFALNHPAALGLDVFRPPQLKQGQVSVVLSFHDKDAGLAMRVRSGLAVAGTQVCLVNRALQSQISFPWKFNFCCYLSDLPSTRVPISEAVEIAENSGLHFWPLPHILFHLLPTHTRQWRV